MKETKFNHGHRWTNEELKGLMILWQAGTAVADIAENLACTNAAILKMVNKLRKQGIPLTRRTSGHVPGRVNKPWTQEEVEYIYRRRLQKATVEDIAHELGRSLNGTNTMIQKLRREGAPIAMLGNGVRKLWDAQKLMGIALAFNKDEVELISP